VICVYLFWSGFNEANEPSSTCRLCFKLRVETSTPPSKLNIARDKFLRKYWDPTPNREKTLASSKALPDFHVQRAG